MQNKFNIGIAALALSAAIFVAQPTFAQGPNGIHPGGPQGQRFGGPGGPGGPGMGGRRGGGFNVDRMAVALNLTAQQKAQIKTIMDNSRAHAQAIMQNASLSQDQKKAQFMTMRKASMAQVQAILTPEQKAKWQQMRQQMRQNRGAGGNWGGRPGGAPGGAPNGAPGKPGA